MAIASKGVRPPHEWKLPPSRRVYVLSRRSMVRLVNHCRRRAAAYLYYSELVHPEDFFLTRAANWERLAADVAKSIHLFWWN